MSLNDEVEGLLLNGRSYSYYRPRFREDVVIGRFDGRLIAFKDIKSYGRFRRSRNGDV